MGAWILGVILNYNNDGLLKYNNVCHLCILVVQLAVKLHPDKNGAPGADDAFKSMFLI